MKSLARAKTEQNLLKSFVGEFQTKTRYTLFAEKAKKEGFPQVAATFNIVAKVEVEHMDTFMKLQKFQANVRYVE